MFSNGVTNVYGGGSITSLTESGGTVKVWSSATIATLTAGGTSQITVDGTIGNSFSASVGSTSLTISGSGSIDEHLQSGGTLVMTSGVTTRAVRGFGSLSIGSIITEGIFASSSGASTIVLSSANAVAVIAAGTVLDSSTANGVTNLTVLVGGFLQRHNVSGGTVRVNNSGGVAAVGSLSGYGVFEVTNGTVDTLSTSGNATIHVRKNASIGTLLVGGLRTTITLESGAFVTNITLLAAASDVSITLNGHGSGYGTLTGKTGTFLDTLTIVLTNFATLGCIDLRAVATRRFALFCSNVYVQQSQCSFLALSHLAASIVEVVVVDSSLDVTDHPVLLLDQNMSSVTTLFSRCNLTARKSGVLQLSARAAGIASLNVTVSNCVVAVYQSSGGLLLVNGTSGTEAVRYIAIINSAVTVDTQPPVITFVSGDAISAVRGTKMLTVVVLGGVWTWPGDAGPAIVFDVDGRMGGGGAWGLSSLSVTNVVFVVDLGGSDVVRPTMSVVEFRGGLTGTLFSHGSIALSNISLATTQATTTPTILPPAIVSFLVISGAAVFVGVDIRVVACRAPLWNLVGNVRTAICVQSSDSGAPNITNSTMTVQDGLGGLPSNVTAVAVDTNVSATGGGMSLIHSCTIIVRCMDMATTGVSVVEMSGTVVNSTIRVELVAIHQAENNDVALVRLQSATSTSSSSTENRVQIVHSNVKVPALIFSSTGAAAFADGGIVLQCSYVGTMPLNAGLLDQFLAAKVSTELSMCASTKRSVMPSDLVFDLEAAQCWSTLTPSVSASTLASFTESHSEIRSATVSRRTPSTTTSLAASTTRTSSPTLSISRTWSKSTVVTMSFSWSSSSSNTTSLSRSTTLSGASRTATPSRTVTLSTSATHSLLQTPSNSTTWSPSMTHIATATQGSATQSSATLLPSSSASLKFCECTGSLIEALNVFLAAPERTSSTSSAMVTMLTPAAANGTSLLAAPLSRLALWTSGSINASLSVRRLWSVDHSGNIETDGVETLCWAPAGASVRGVSMSTGATMLPTSSAATDDTVTWVLEVNSVGADNETIEWVPTTVGAYQDTTIRLGVSFVCSAGSPLAPGGVRLSTRSVTMIIPVTKMPQQLAAEVRSSSQVLQFASIMSGAGGSAGRVMATRAVVLCSSDVNSATVSAGPLGLELWSDACDDAGSAISVYRGTIIGNVVLLAVVCAAVLGMAPYVSRSSRVPFVGGLRRVAFPSSLMPVWVVVLPSTGTATMQVIALSSGCAGADVVCAVVGITLVAAPPIALMWLAWWIPSHASVNAIRSASAPAARITLRQQSMWIVRSILRPMWKWSALKPAAAKAEDDESSTRSSADASLRYSVVVLQDYRHVWYAALDTAMLVVVGALVAVSGHGTTQQCIAAGVLVAAAYALQLVVCAALRPFTTIFGGGYALFSLTFTLLGVVLQMSMFAVSGNASTASLLSRLGLAASVCDLMVLGSSFVRTLVDVHDLTREVFVQLGCAAAANAVPVDPRGDLDAKGIAVTWLSLPGAKAFDDESMCGVLPLSPMEMFLLEEHQEAPDGTEHLFWDAEGNAIGLEGESLHRGSSLINVGHDDVNASYL